MRVLIATVLLCVISIVSINAAVSIGLAQVNPGYLYTDCFVRDLQMNLFFVYILDYPGKCWHSRTNTAYSVGTHHPNDTCSEIHCSPSFSLSFYT